MREHQLSQSAQLIYVTISISKRKGFVEYITHFHYNTGHKDQDETPEATFYICWDVNQIHNTPVEKNKLPEYILCDIIILLKIIYKIHLRNTTR